MSNHGRKIVPILLLTAALVACKQSQSRGTISGKKGSVAVDSNRFPHDLHTSQAISDFRGRAIECNDCHPTEAVVKGEYARPGKNEHAPCDECHKDEFYKPPGTFCSVCHDKVDLTKSGEVTMVAYPERGFKRILAAKFSHRLHLNASAMEDAVGFHVSCNDCHVRDDKSRDPMLPGHAQCARCHSDKAKAKQALHMENCDGCHYERDVDLQRGRIFITGDLIFAHADHETDNAGGQIRCAMCHNDIPRSRSAADVSVPPMKQCAVCHEDSSKTPERVRIARCEVCHEVIRDVAMPSNHLVGRGLPEDHTLEFRRNHSEQAADPNSKCGYCHEGVNDNSRDNCHQCHSITRPRDHNLGWRTDSHGREAAANRDRCANCHQPDECVACHSIPPRSHTPLGEFRFGGHADNARFDLRSCFACHTFEDTCVDCHREVR